MKIRTELLQKMVAKAIQGAGNNKMIPLTSLIGIEVRDGLLCLRTTDGSNQLIITEKFEVDPIYGSQEFYTIVNADTFSKLVGKTTKEFIELKNNSNYLEVVGNGIYKLEIAINEEGDMVSFPEIPNITSSVTTINLNNLQDAIKIAKASVAKTMEVPCLTGYYISDNTIATDRQVICTMQNKLLGDSILISAEMAELLLLVEGVETIHLLKENNVLVFTTSNYTLFGKELEGKDKYPVEQINVLTRNNYDNYTKVNKQELLNILDRMSLFVNDYDKNGVYLDFRTNQLCIQSQKSNAVESIDYLDSILANPFSCLVDIEMLKAQVETISTDSVLIYYGQNTSIKIVDGNCTHIISLLEKEN